jgi:hypothetical protein
MDDKVTVLWPAIVAEQRAKRLANDPPAKRARERYAFVAADTKNLESPWYDIEDLGDGTTTPRLMAGIVKLDDARLIVRALNECERLKRMSVDWSEPVPAA